MICYNNQAIAGVAQLVEQLTCNQQVAGSSPIAGSSEIKGFPETETFFCALSRGGEGFFNKNLQLNRLI